MAISIDLPPDLERSLRHQVHDLDLAAKEALLVDLYRRRKLTQAQLGKALHLSRTEVDGLLKRHEIFLDLTAEDVIQESSALSKARSDNADHR